MRMGDDKKTVKKIQLIGNVNIPSFLCAQCEVPSPLRPGSRARLRALGALGILEALWWSLMHF